MAAGRKRKRGHEDSHPDERWLLTYADMITLLMALFMVLFSISSVNTTKFESLQRAMKDAFSGKVLPGGHAVMQTGGATKPAALGKDDPQANAQPYDAGGTREQRAAMARQEEEDLRKLQRRVQRIARELGLASKVKVKLGADGLVVRLLTDDLLFDSGQARPKPGSFRLLGRLGVVLASERRHPVLVEGHTDNVPTAGSPYPSNWELSTARASAIARALLAGGVRPSRLTAAGRAYFEPTVSNATPAGRGLNRRVELLLPRLATASGPTSAAGRDSIPSIRPQRPSIKPGVAPPITTAGATGAPAAMPTPASHP